MGVSHKNTTHTTMKTAFPSRDLALLPGCRPPGKRAGRLERDRAYYPAQPGRRSRRDTPISSPKDIAGYRPNGPFNTCTSTPPTLAEILRVLLETRLDKAGDQAESVPRGSWRRASPPSAVLSAEPEGAGRIPGSNRPRTKTLRAQWAHEMAGTRKITDFQLLRSGTIATYWCTICCETPRVRNLRP